MTYRFFTHSRPQGPGKPVPAPGLAIDMPPEVIRSAMRILNAHVPPKDLQDIVMSLLAQDISALGGMA